MNGSQHRVGPSRQHGPIVPSEIVLAARRATTVDRVTVAFALTLNGYMLGRLIFG